MKFKAGQKVKPSAIGKERWKFQIGKSKYGKILSSIYDGTKTEGDFPYRIEWENGISNTYREQDVERFNTSLENK